MEELLNQLSGLPAWKIHLIASGLLLQGFILTVFPEEVIVTTLGLLWSQGRVEFLPCLLCVWIGLLPANAATVLIGDRLGMHILRRRPFKWVVSADAIAEGLNELKRWGPWVVFATRFTPIIRGPIYFSAGISKMGVFKFMRIDALASCIQVPMLLLIGRAIGKSAESLMQGYQRIGMLLALLLGATILYQVYRSRKKPRARARS